MRLVSPEKYSQTLPSACIFIGMHSVYNCKHVKYYNIVIKYPFSTMFCFYVCVRKYNASLKKVYCQNQIFSTIILFQFLDNSDQKLMAKFKQAIFGLKHITKPHF